VDRYRPHDFEENGPQSVETIGNQIVMINYNLTLALGSDDLDPVAPVWKSDADKDQLIDTLVKKYKDEVRTV
jgi:hypothetical protein